MPAGRPAMGSSGPGFFGAQRFVLGLELFARFTPLRVEGNAGDRAHLLALRFVEMADAFGAFMGIDLVKLRAHRDRFVRALGLAHVAIDAVVGNQQSHGINLIYAFAAARDAIFFCSQRSTDGKTNLDTSPPSIAISRTMVPDMNWYWSDGVRNRVSTSGSR